MGVRSVVLTTFGNLNGRFERQKNEINGGFEWADTT